MTFKKAAFYTFLVAYAIADGICSPISAIRSQHAFERCRVIFFLIGAPLPFIWYYLDANERGFNRTTGLKLLIVLLALIGIPVYLFKSRSRKKALIGTVIFISVIVGIAIVTAVTSRITLKFVGYV